MFANIPASVNTSPDFLIGVKGGSSVLVPVDQSLAGPTAVTGADAANLAAYPRTSAQLAAAPSAADIALGTGAVFTLNTDPTVQYKVNPLGTAYVLAGGGVAPVPPVVRAQGSGMRAYVNYPILGGWSMCYRARFRTLRKIVRFKAVIPTFYIGGGFVDTDFPVALNFQMGLEYPYTAALTGLAARVPVLWSGANTVSYGGPGTNTFGYLVSDWVMPSAPIPAGAYFGLHTTSENPATTSNTLPYMYYPSNAAQAYEGFTFAASSLIAAGTALTATSVSAITNSLTPTLPYSFGPCMLLAEYANGEVCTLITGDSIGYGFGEGTAGSGNYGAFNTGSQFRNSGWPARYVNEKCNLDYVNTGVPGDDYSTFNTGTNAKYRLQLFTLANPTHTIIHLGSNGIVAGLSNSTMVTNANNYITKLRTAIPNSKMIHCTVMPRASTYVPITAVLGDGTNVTATTSAAFISSVGGVGATKVVSVLGFTTQAAYNSLNTTITVASATTFTYANTTVTPATQFGSVDDLCTTLTNQTVAIGFGGSASTRSQFNAVMRATPSVINCDDVIDICPWVESGYQNGVQASETSKWIVNGSPNLLTADSIHTNSYGNYVIVTNQPPYVFKS